MFDGLDISFKKEKRPINYDIYHLHYFFCVRLVRTRTLFVGYDHLIKKKRNRLLSFYY